MNVNLDQFQNDILCTQTHWSQVIESYNKMGAFEYTEDNSLDQERAFYIQKGLEKRFKKVYDNEPLDKFSVKTLANQFKTHSKLQEVSVLIATLTKGTESKNIAIITANTKEGGFVKSSKHTSNTAHAEIIALLKLGDFLDEYDLNPGDYEVETKRNSRCTACENNKILFDKLLQTLDL